MTAHTPIHAAAHHGTPRPEPVRIDALSARIAKWQAGLAKSPEWLATERALADEGERWFDANLDRNSHPAFTAFAPINRDSAIRKFVQAMRADRRGL